MSKKTSKHSSIGARIRAAVALFTLISGATIVAAVLASGLLPVKYGIFLVVAALFVCVLAATLLTVRPTGKRKIAGYASSVIIILLSSVGTYGVISSMNFLGQVTAGNTTVHKKNIDSTKPFNVYISGIDTYGDLSTVSRSDVNIVATVNPATKHILLTTIPRDSYVAIAGGGNDQYDKLTHSGIYGIDASEKTVARLVDTKIDSYVRINFTTFMNIVDGIGGVTVDNPITFTNDGGQTFQQGKIYLNGWDALMFSRERHNLAGGDNDRGVNQERVMTAIFQKLISPSMIYHYQDVLNIIGRSVQTDISQASLVSLIRQQINDGSKWTITSSAIGGTGETGQLPSYAMPGSQLYMFVLDDNSLQQARQRIKDALLAK